MRYPLIAILCILLFHSPAFAGSVFQKRYVSDSGDVWFDAVQPTLDGGYIMLGSIIKNNSPSLVQLYLLKTDKDGNTLWNKLFKADTTAAYVQLRGCDIKQKSNGNFIISAAYSASAIGAASEQLVCMGIDASGNIQWTRYLPGSAIGISTNSEFYQLNLTDDDGFIVSGTNKLYKFNANGDLIWHKETTGMIARPVAAGGYIALGEDHSGPIPNLSIIRLNNTGNINWTKTFGTTNLDYMVDIQPYYNDYIVTAGSMITVNSYDIYIVRLDSNGNVKWQRTIGHTSSDLPTGLTFSPADGNIVIAGITESFGGVKAISLRWTVPVIFFGLLYTENLTISSSIVQHFPLIVAM